ncbi:hypothetical protein Y032_0074g876 [Ancylostoma ceylanicum]|uniref:Uncharacterized protein n=1 Tax=Ancylostoma ceylanicum TaxID=53326 RepID=A0A016TVA9_9BILA|nr:hypothetical protein Y032_0074g876 [Ancylostoma ceylanicum]
MRRGRVAACLAAASPLIFCAHSYYIDVATPIHVQDLPKQDIVVCAAGLLVNGVFLQATHSNNGVFCMPKKISSSIMLDMVHPLQIRARLRKGVKEKRKYDAKVLQYDQIEIQL